MLVAAPCCLQDKWKTDPQTCVLFCFTKKEAQAGSTLRAEPDAGLHPKTLGS